MNRNIIIIGGGVSGLTAAAYLSKAGMKVTLLEKSENLGGLLGSFRRNGFVFDSGIRAIENSGTVFPMLRELGIEVPFKKNLVSIGIENHMVELSSKDGLSEYMKLLLNIFPEEESEIREIIELIIRISEYMDVLYGVDNPLFLDIKKDREYFVKTILPWMFKYISTINKIQKLRAPVNVFLSNITKNQSLIDMITQHFFKDTPTFFALSYFRLYTDYYYPIGGTGVFVDELEKSIIKNNGQLMTNAEVVRVDVSNKVVYCSNNTSFEYDRLLWAADLKSLYSLADVEQIRDIKLKTYKKNVDNIMRGKGNDSIFSLYLLTDLNPGYYSGKCSEHTFYTPKKTGLSSIKLSVGNLILEADRNTGSKKRGLLFDWVKEYAQKTTYEISIPVLRDQALAPSGKSGLIISTVFDFSLTDYFYQNGLYEEFKEVLSAEIIDVLSKSVFPGLKDNIIEFFSSSPFTIKNRLNNTDGAITGWSFTLQSPVENRLYRIAKSVDTPFNDIYQSGHWVFSPAGLPTSIITAKLAADKLIKG